MLFDYDLSDRVMSLIGSFAVIGAVAAVVGAAGMFALFAVHRADAILAPLAIWLLGLLLALTGGSVDQWIPFTISAVAGAIAFGAGPAASVVRRQRLVWPWGRAEAVREDALG